MGNPRDECLAAESEYEGKEKEEEAWLGENFNLNLHAICSENVPLDFAIHLFQS